MRELSTAQARRVALAAQGFDDPPHARVTMRTFERTVGRTGVLQVDSVNVVQRAHFMPLYSRMGPYDIDLLRRASEVAPRRVVEYWAHVQAFMPVGLWPFMEHRREAYRARRDRWQVLAEDPGLEVELLAEIADRGPSTARELDDGLPRSREHWGWNWSRARQVLDYLFMVGDLAVAGRNSAFEVRYDLPERVLAAAVLAQPVPPAADQHRELVRRAARSHGVATLPCLRDYYRMASLEQTRVAVENLVAEGELEPVRVQGWDRTAYLHREARLPRRVRSRALLSPFDPLVWERERTQRLFDFRYRIEIYVPAHRRVHGYYVLPFLLDDDLVARVDLKADRAAGALLVRAAFAEPGAPPHTAVELAQELGVLAGWLGLDRVRVEDRGDLAAALAEVVSSAAG